MPLLEKGIRESLQRPQKTEAINKARRHENRLRFHVETHMSRHDAATACNEFLQWVEQLLPRDKYHLFLMLFRFPVPTNEITEKIFKELKKIFDGRNPYFNYEFTDPDLEDDWNEYKDQEFGGQEIWQTVAYEKMKAAINSVMIIDMPTEQESGRPEPFIMWKDIDEIHDYRTIDGSQFDWITYKISEKTDDDQKVEYFVVIDDESYRIFRITEKGEINPEPILENRHELGLCPARFFWTTPLRQNAPDIKKSPISNQLSNLDRLLKRYVDKDFSDLSAAYPIYWAIEQDCDYKDDRAGHTCDAGFLRSVSGQYILTNSGRVQRCPVCSEKRMTGPGAFVEIPVPDKEVDLREPLGIINADVPTLKYQTDEIRRHAHEVFTNVVGVGGEIHTEQAMNEKQIVGAVENKETVLLDLKRDFEYAQLWAEDVMCRLRYQTQYVNLSINYGTEFYQHTVTELNDRYDKAKKAGQSEIVLDSLQEQIIETEYRNNPVQLQRALLLRHLEPYRHHTTRELLDMQRDNPALVNDDLLRIKINFSTFIARFEREQTSILEWGANLEFDARVRKITKILLGYGQESRGDEKPPKPDNGDE